MFDSPNLLFTNKISLSLSFQNSVEICIFMNPGPAKLASNIYSDEMSSGTISSAKSNGFILNCLDSIIATFVEISPCFWSFGLSTEKL